MKLRILTTLLLLILTYQGFGQTLKGRITDKLSQMYLEGIEIYIPEIEKRAVTDQFGSYELKELPKGKFKIQVSAAGYQTEIQFIELLENVNIMNAQMSRNLMHQKDITLSAPYFKSKNEHTVKLIQVKINQYGQGLRRNIGEELSRIAGVANNNYGWSSSQPIIRMQDTRKITILSNGVQLQTLPWQRYHDMPVSSIGLDKIEILKGPGSLLYGGSALGGVLYLVDEKPAELLHLHGDVSTLGSFNGAGLQTNAGIKYSGNEFQYSFRIGREDYSDAQLSLDNTPNSRINNSRYNRNFFKANIGYNNPNISSKLKINYQSENKGIINGLGNDASRSPATEGISENQFLTIAHKNIIYVKKSRVNVNYGINNYTINNSGFQNSNYTANGYNYDINWKASINNNSNLIIGNQFSSQYYNPLASNSLIPSGSEFERSTFLFINHSDSGNKTNIQLGFRYNTKNVQAVSDTNSTTSISITNLNETFNGISAAVGGSLKASETVTFRLNMAAGFRAPNIAELASNGSMPYTAGDGTAIVELGNPDLKNETSSQFDFGMDIKRENLSISFSVYNYDILNYIQLQELEDSSIGNQSVYQYNQVNANIYGTEVSFEYSPYRFDWLLIESSLDFSMGLEDNAGGILSEKVYLSNVPAAKWQTNLRFFPKWKIGNFEQFFFNLEGSRYFGRSLGNDPVLNYAAINMANIHFGAKLPWSKQFIEIAISANNLLDNRDPFPVMRGNFPNLRNPGRNILLGIKVPFSKDMTPNKRQQITVPSRRG